MKRLFYWLAFAIGLTSIIGAEAVNAAFQPSAVAPAFDAMDEVLLANRLRNRGNFRFRVRPSRFRRGGFSRGSCPEEKAYGISPKMDDFEASGDFKKEPAPAYLTASDHPTLFMKVPALPSEAHGQLHIEIENPDATTRNPKLYTAAFDLSGQEGIVGVRMPTEATALEAGKSYKWKVVISCSEDLDDLSTIPFLGGVVERVADIAGTPEEKFDYYWDEGIWQEVATLIAEERYNNASPEADANWADLMGASGLAEYATTTIVEIVDATLFVE
ncbi:MAG: DUF928 domain-containing protein [Cyanobacteria bacterium J06638_20]